MEAGRIVLDERDDGSEHQRSAEQENEFIETHGWGEYSTWHLGTDDEHRPETKGRAAVPDEAGAY